MIRVALIDDHNLLRQGTRTLLDAAPDIEVAAEGGTGREALALARRVRPDVMVLDIKLPDMSGVEVARALREDYPEVKVLVLSAYSYEQYVRALFAIDVHGYLLKNASGAELVEAVRAVARGEVALSAEVAARAAGARRSGIGATETLTEREREALALVSRGESNKEIARALGIGVRTAETYVSGAMAKLGARSRTEAVRIAAERGIIVIDA